MMHSLLSFGSGFVLSASLIVAIGAQNLFVLRQGVKQEHVGAIVLFCGFSDAVLIIAGVSGMGGLVSTFPTLSVGVTLLGAIFLAWYGAKSLRRAAQHDSMSVEMGQSVPLRKVLASVAAFTWLNPHVYLDTVLLMGAAATAQPMSARPFFAVGAASASFLWFAVLGYGARLLQPVFARPRAWQVLDCIIGGVMFALAGSLLWHSGLYQFVTQE